MKGKIPKLSSKKEIIAEITRVDLAGEYGAKRIYEGQLSVFKKGKAHQEIKHMYQQELKHLEYFQQQVSSRRVRPTIFHPIWHVAGFALGKVSAMLGEKAAMATTVAIEDVIADHYQEQINELENHPEEKELLAKIKKFREEEIEHKDHGIANDAEKTPGYKALYKTVQAISKVAIFLSKRF